MPFYGDVKLQQKLIWMEAKYYKYRMFLQNQLLLKAMFAFACYAFLRIGEITTKQ
jgi:hypothetical protein